MSLSTPLSSPPPQDVPGLPETDQPQFKGGGASSSLQIRKENWCASQFSENKFNGWFWGIEVMVFRGGKPDSQDRTSHWWATKIGWVEDERSDIYLYAKPHRLWDARIALKTHSGAVEVPINGSKGWTVSLRKVPETSNQCGGDDLLKTWFRVSLSPENGPFPLMLTKAQTIENVSNKIKPGLRRRLGHASLLYWKSFHVASQEGHQHLFIYID